MASKQTYKFFLEGIANLDIKGLKSGVQQASQYLSKIKMPEDLQKDFDKQIKEILNGVDKFQKKMEDGFHSEKEVQQAYRDYEKLLKLIDQLGGNLGKLGKNSPKLEVLSSQISKQFREAKKAFDDFTQATSQFDAAWKEISKNASKPVKARFNIDEIKQAAQEGKNFQEATGRSLAIINDEIKAEEDRINSLTAAWIKADEARQSADPGKRQEYWDEQLKIGGKSKSGGQIAEAQKRLTLLQEEQGVVAALSIEYGNFAKQVQSITFEGVSYSFAELEQILSRLAAEHGQELNEFLQKAQQGAGQAQTAVEGMKTAVEDLVDTSARAAEAERQMGQLQSRMMHFFSLANGWNLVRRAVRNAFNVIKDLDRQMTEIAVVTQMTLDEVWAKRDTYVKTARELGAATLDVVAASKLYYQQGLSEAEVNQITTETIKMARIAHLDGARATDLMTAALRGFNLEMSQSAHVNDVYSQLAAKSAADVEEIANAMTKTASIAHSAGASLDNTAAFLTQMIETTREASENLGTAMKTIVARFQEMKKAPADIGEIDGEIVDANKFETALKTVGIALRDLRTGEFRNFDDVIMEISAKWDSMDQLTQRYIATTAAGSRQQSRFIALVSNHSRLMELTGLAADSAGASQEQFNKTLDSLESKLNQLKNGLELFYTTLMNSSVIKLVVDILTKVINLVNTLTKQFGSLGGSIVGAFTAVTAFKGAGKILNKIFMNIGLSTGMSTSKGWFTGFVKSLSNANLKKATEEMAKDLTASVESFKAASGQMIRSKEAAIELQQTYSILGRTVENFGPLTNLQIRHLTQEEIQRYATAAATLEEAAATGANVTSAEVEQATNEVTILRKMAEIRAREVNSEAMRKEALSQAGVIQHLNTFLKTLWLTIIGKNQETGLTLRQAAANLKEAVTTKIKTAAAYGYLVVALLIIGAVVALVAAIIKASKADQERYKKIQEKIENYNTEIENTQSALSDLSSAHEELAEKQSIFENLTKGTQEWKEALIDVNSKVLEIVSNYPELASHITNGIHGELKISGEGFDKYIETQNARISRLQSAQLQAQIDLAKTSFKIDHKREFGKGETQAVQEVIAAGYRAEDLKDPRSQASQLLKSIYSEYKPPPGTTTPDRGEWDSRFDSFRRGLASSDAELLEFSRAIQQTGQEIAGLEKTIVESLIMGDAELSKLYTEDSSRALIEAAGSAVLQQDQSEYEKIRQQAQGLFRQEAREEYARLTNQSLAEVKRQIDAKEINYDTIRDEIGIIKVQEAQTKAIKENIEALKALPKNLQQSFSNVIRGGGAQANKKDVTEMLAQLGLDYSTIRAQEKGDVIELLSDSNNVSSDLMNLLGIKEGEFEQFYEFLLELVVQNEEAISATRQKLAEKDQVVFDELTYEMGRDALEAFGDNLQSIVVSSGQEAAGTVLGILSDLQNNVDEDKFNEIMNFVQVMDFKNKKDIQEFSALLTDLGVGWDSKKINQVADDLITVNNSFYKMSLTELKEQVNSLGKTIRDINLKGKQTFSQEDYDKIKEARPDLAWKFVQDLGGEFHYLGTNIRELTKVYEETLKEKKQDSLDVLTGKVAAGEAAKSGKVYSYERYGWQVDLDFDSAFNSDEMDQKAFLQAFFKDLETQGVDTFKTFGILPENLSTLDKENLQNIMNEISEYSENIQGNKEEKALAEYQVLVSDLEQRLPLDILEERLNTLTVEGLAPYSAALGIQASGDEDLTLAVDALRKAQEAGDAVAIRYHQSVLGDALEYKRLTNDIKKVEEVIEDTYNLLKKDPGDPVGLLNAQQILENVLGLTDTDISPDFLKDAENMKVFLEVLEGKQGAWEQFRGQIGITELEMEEFVNSFSQNATELALIEEALSNEDFQINGKADFSKIYAALEGVEEVSAETLGMLQGLANSDVQFEPVWQTASFPPGTEPKKHLTGFTGQFSTRDNLTRTNPFAGTSLAQGLGDKDGKGGAGKSWENTYDWLYNLIQKTNKEIRKRNTLERQYNKLLTDRKQTLTDVLENVQAQEDSLKQQLQYYNDQEKGRKIELEEINKAFSSVKQYAHYDKALGAVQIDWAALDKITDEATGERAAKYIQELERIQSELESIEDAQRDTIDALEELQNLGKDEFLELEQRVLDAIIAARQYEIDYLETINDNISNSNSKLLNQLQKGIDAQRQSRQKEKTQGDISKKERRLALLQQDASGANALEIMKLQEELENDRQSYTDSLIDNILQDLQEGNERAAEQRALQIQVLQRQLEFEQENGLLWDQVHALLVGAINSDGSLNVTSSLHEFLNTLENTNAMSAIKREDWNKDLNAQLQAGMTWYERTIHPATSSDVYDLSRAVSGLDSKIVTALASSDKFKDPNTGDIKNNTDKAVGLLAKIRDNTGQDVKIEVKGGGGGGGIGGGSFNMYITKYKTGGLADFTGPAWLDGTKSNPELILNAQDTKNFIALKDVLNSTLRNANSGGSSGDNYYQFDVNIDQLANDYDVEQLVSKMKRMIVEDAQYRNVNALSFNAR